MQRPPAYLLVFHGSSDLRPQAAAHELARLFSERICHTNLGTLFDRSPSDRPAIRSDSTVTFPGNVDVLNASMPPVVGVAALEGNELSLIQQICRFGRISQPPGTNAPETNGTSAPSRLLVLPLFLLPGVHVMDDIPAQVALAQTTLGSDVSIEIAPYLGSHPKLYRLIAERMSALPVEASILLSHGSRRADAKQPIEALAEKLGAVTAYWAIPPNLESRLQELNSLGLRKIAILPYFLFAGSTTDAIAQTIDRLSHQFPKLDLHLTPPLEAYPELADLLVDLAIGERGKGGF